MVDLVHTQAVRDGAGNGKDAVGCGLAQFGYLEVLSNGMYGELGPTVANSLVSLNVDASNRGEALGVANGLIAAASAAGPLLAGWVFGAIGTNALFVIVAVIAALAMILNLELKMTAMIFQNTLFTIPTGPFPVIMPANMTKLPNGLITS